MRDFAFGLAGVGFSGARTRARAVRLPGLRSAVLELFDLGAPEFQCGRRPHVQGISATPNVENLEIRGILK